MMQLRLSESTATKVRIPVFLVDDTDGKTPETGVTISAGELKICKNGAAWANAAGTWTEVGEGLYHYTPTSGELNTIGFFVLKLVKTGIRNDPTLVQVRSDDPYLSRNPRGIVAANGGNTATTFCTNLASSVTDFYKGPMLVHFLDGALEGQTRPLATPGGYNGTTKFLTVSAAFTGTPATGTEFEIIAQ
jgi:hypothetical protein